MNYNPSKLLKQVIARYPFLTEGTAGASYDGLVETLRASLTAGESLTLPGFGRFVVRVGATRTGFNPKTKERITIPPKPRIKFVPDKTIEVGVPK